MSGQGRADHGPFGIGLGAEQAGEPVNAVAPYAARVRGRPAVRVLGELHAQRQVKRMQAQLLQAVRQLLNTMLVPHGRVFVVLASRCRRTGPRRAGRAPRTGARLGRSTAPGPGSSAARPRATPFGCWTSPKSAGSSRKSAAPYTFESPAHVVVQLGPEGPVAAGRRRSRPRCISRRRRQPASSSCRVPAGGSHRVRATVRACPFGHAAAVARPPVRCRRPGRRSDRSPPGRA